jgi:tRNA (guanine-N7-)-methyltransferase
LKIASNAGNDQEKNLKLNNFMKRAQDLVIPCTWDNRCPMLLKKFFYIPANYNDYSQFTLPALKDIFANDNPVNIEYCSGNGQWVIERAKRERCVNWVAVEKRFDRARKTWVKAANNGIDNLLIVFGEAEVFTKYYLHDGVISSCYINFPDPWPKRRHMHNRLIKKEFLQELGRVMVIGGDVMVVSDDMTSLESMRGIFLSSGEWKEVSGGVELMGNIVDFGVSYFADLWCKKGRKIGYFSFSH